MSHTISPLRADDNDVRKMADALTGREVQGQYGYMVAVLHGVVSQLARAHSDCTTTGWCESCYQLRKALAVFYAMDCVEPGKYWAVRLLWKA